MKTLIITEKPSVAQAIAAVVGALARKDGYIPPTATTHNKRLCTLNIVANPIAAIAAATAYTQ